MAYIKDFLEEGTGAMSNRPFQLNGSTDNALLFSVMGRIYCDGVDDSWLNLIIEQRTITPGCYKRHPGESWPSQHDDHIAVACYKQSHAKEILEYGIRHWFLWSDKSLIDTVKAYGIKGFFDRFFGIRLLFICTTIIAAKREVGFVTGILLSFVYLSNCFEDRRKTSGKQLLLLVRDTQLFGLSCLNPLWHALNIWQRRMESIYPAGPSQMLRYYYNESEQEYGMIHAIPYYALRHWSVLG